MSFSEISRLNTSYADLSSVDSVPIASQATKRSASLELPLSSSISSSSRSSLSQPKKRQRMDDSTVVQDKFEPFEDQRSLQFLKAKIKNEATLEVALDVTRTMVHGMRRGFYNHEPLAMLELVQMVCIRAQEIIQAYHPQLLESAFDLYLAFTLDEEFREELLELLLKHRKDQNQDVRDFCLGTLAHLTTKDLSYPDAREVIQSAIGREEDLAQKASLVTLKMLIEMKQEFFAYYFPPFGTNISEQRVCKRVLEVLIVLVMKGKNLSEASSIASRIVCDDDRVVYKLALKVFEAFLKKGGEIAQKIKADIDQLQSISPMSRQYAELRILKEIYELGEKLMPFDTFSLVTDYAPLSRDPTE